MNAYKLPYQEECWEVDGDVDEDSADQEEPLPKLKTYKEAITALEDMSQFLEYKRHGDEALSVGSTIDRIVNLKPASPRHADNTTWLFYSVIMTVYNSFVWFLHPQHSQYFNHQIIHNHCFSTFNICCILLIIYPYAIISNIIETPRYDRDTKDKDLFPKYPLFRGLTVHEKPTSMN